MCVGYFFIGWCGDGYGGLVFFVQSQFGNVWFVFNENVGINSICYLVYVFDVV